MGECPRTDAQTQAVPMVGSATALTLLTLNSQESSQSHSVLQDLLASAFCGDLQGKPHQA